MNMHIPMHFTVDSYTILDIQPGVLCLRTGRIVEKEGIAGETLHAALTGLLVRPNEDFSVHLEDMWQRQDWQDACIWGLVCRENTQPYALINLLADSYPTRRDQSMNRIFIPEHSPLKIVVPFAEADFTEMHYYIFAPTEQGRFISNLPFTQVEEAYMVEHRWDVLPELTLTGPDSLAPDATALFTVQSFLQGEAFTQPLDVSLEHVNGYLPKTRIRVNGMSTFPVQALGLHAGDTIKLKAGFRYLGARAESTIRIL